MKLSWNRLALILGAVVLSLTVIDGLAKMSSSAAADFGVGTGPLVAADSAAAVFLIGLVFGVIGGIGLFFAFLVWREKQSREEVDEVAVLLEEVAAEEKRNAFHREESYSEERAESLDPWERPADWWKNADDE